MASGLILVDIQNEYFPGGRLELAGIQQASINASALLVLFRDRGWPTFHVQHLAQQADAPLFTPGTPFAEIHQSVKPLPGEPLIQKHFPNSFHQTPLLEGLKARGVDLLVRAARERISFVMRRVVCRRPPCCHFPKIRDAFGSSP